MSDRRLHTERRTNIDRRRLSDHRQAAIEICRSEMRLAILQKTARQDPAQVATRTISWRKQATSYFSDTAVAELKTAFSKLVVDENLAGSTIRIVLSGDLCVTRVLTGTADYVRKEMALLEDRSQLYLSLGPGIKAVAGSIQQLDARHQIALLTVANQKTMDSLLEVASAAGVKIESVEPSLVALSRIIGYLEPSEDEPQIVVHLDGNTFELGICHRGQLLLDYRPANRSDSIPVAVILRQHLTRLQRYCDQHYRFLNKPLRRVFLCGKTIPTRVALASFAQCEGLQAEMIDLSIAAQSSASERSAESRDQTGACQQQNPAAIPPPVKLFPIEWEYAGKPPECGMAAVLGAILTSEQHAPTAMGPNLMAYQTMQDRVPIGPVLIRSLAPIAAMLFLMVTLFLVNWNQRGTIETINSQLQSLNPILDKTTQLRLALHSTENQLMQYENLESKLQDNYGHEVVSLIGKCLPEEVWLDRITILNDSRVSLSGASYADRSIHEFVEWLEKAPGFDQVALGGTRTSQSPSGSTIKYDIDFLFANFIDSKK